MAEYIEREALLEKLAEHDLCLCVSESDIKKHARRRRCPGGTWAVDES